MSDPKQPVFINRHLFDAAKPVSVYRNLHVDMWSIKQGNLVVAHADRVLLEDVIFHTNPKGINRIRQKKRKEVCAWVRGILVDFSKLSDLESKILSDPNASLPYDVVTFDPYKYYTFVKKDSEEPILSCDFADMDINGDFGDRILAIYNNAENAMEDWL